MFVDEKSIVRYREMRETFNCGEHPAPGEDTVYMMYIERIDGDAEGHDNETALWEDFAAGGNWAQDANECADCYNSSETGHYN